MEIFKICAVGVITALCVLAVKEHRTDLAILIGVVGGLMITLSVLSYLRDAISFVNDIASRVDIDSTVLKSLLKIVLIGYLCDFSSNLVADMGSNSLSEKIVMGGKVLIFVASIPIIKLLIEVVEVLLS